MTLRYTVITDVQRDQLRRMHINVHMICANGPRPRVTVDPAWSLWSVEIPFTDAVQHDAAVTLLEDVGLTVLEAEPAYEAEHCETCACWVGVRVWVESAGRDREEAVRQVVAVLTARSDPTGAYDGMAVAAATEVATLG